MLTPTQIPSLTDIVSIASGESHCFAVDRFGRVYAWGVNDHQKCGLVKKPLGGKKEILPGRHVCHPELLPYFDTKKVVQQYPTYNAPVRIKHEVNEDSLQKSIQYMDIDPTVDDIEKSDDMEEDIKVEEEIDLLPFNNLTVATNNIFASDAIIKPPSNPIKLIAAGLHHTIVVTNDNKLIVFGNCAYGQLGSTFYPGYHYAGEVRSKKSNTVEAIGYPMINSWHCKQEIVKVVCGDYHTLVLTKEGTVYGFGNSETYQLGMYTTGDVYYPMVVDSIRGKVIDISTASGYTMFIIAK